MFWTEFDEPRHPCEGCPLWDNAQCEGDLDSCPIKEEDGEHPEQIIAPDKANRRPESVLCGNCGVYRMVDDQWYVETCPNCGDDEWSIIEAEMEDVP